MVLDPAKENAPDRTLKKAPIVDHPLPFFFPMRSPTDEPWEHSGQDLWLQLRLNREMEVLPLILFSVCCSPNGILRDSSSSSPLPEEFHIERISTPDRATKFLKDSACKRDGILSAELKETSKLS
ncbi:hypothetical protein Salat_2358900 [Sesamum alatum]|uniref:Uncharacterized protein n=1 Tax=Sesamum alatum TaxID=300844 RepID=A0AAE1XWU2_9LAMI|nr:hypothetical protein Salat_2358900 [Sesamum alatum]